MTQATKHTPTPWRAVGFTVETLDLNPICRVSKTAAHATHDNAAHIVRCVNAHDELVAALKGALVLLERLAPDTDRKLVGGSECSIGHYASYHVDVIRAALANLS